MPTISRSYKAKLCPSKHCRPRSPKRSADVMSATLPLSSQEPAPPLLDPPSTFPSGSAWSRRSPGSISMSGRRGAGAGRRERRRQVDDDADPRRRVHAGLPARLAFDGVASDRSASRPMPRRRHPRHPPGAGDRPGPVGGGEHLHRRLAGQCRHIPGSVATFAAHPRPVRPFGLRDSLRHGMRAGVSAPRSAR